MEFTNGQRVRYTGTLIHRLKGQEGTFQTYGPEGWALVDFDAINIGLVPVAPVNLEALALTFQQFVGSKKWTDTICAAMGFDDGCEERGGFIYDDGGCYIEKSPNGQYRLLIERSEWVRDDLRTLELILWALHYAPEMNADLSGADLDAFIQGKCAANGWRIDGDLFSHVFSGKGPWTADHARAMIEKHAEQLKADALASDNLRFTRYDVRPVIEENGACVSYPDEADFLRAVEHATRARASFKAFWTIYGTDTEGLQHAIGDFDTKEGATAIKNAIWRNPVIVKIDVQAADAAADFLDNEAANNTNGAAWAMERAKAFGEVADALRALTNDTDAIVTDETAL